MSTDGEVGANSVRNDGPSQLHAAMPQAGYYLSSRRPEVETLDLFMEGSLPTWLKGALYRNGPGKYEAGSGGPLLGHLFDGFALLQQYTVDGSKQKMTAHTRFLQSGSFCGAEDHCRPVKRDFGTDPCGGLFSRLSLLFDPASNLTDNASANLVRLGGELVALTETSLGFVIDGNTLDTLGGYTALREPRWAGELIVSPTAHVMSNELLRATVNLQSHIGALASLSSYSITITPWELPGRQAFSVASQSGSSEGPRVQADSTSPSLASEASVAATAVWNSAIEKHSRLINVAIPPLCTGTGTSNRSTSAASAWWNRPRSSSALQPTYHHSFSMTERYLIICEAPMRFSALAAAKVMFTGSLVLDLYPWTGDTDSTRFLVVDLQTGELVASAPVPGPGFLTFHHINSFETSDSTTITVDLCAYDNPDFLQEMRLDRLRSGESSGPSGGYFRRFEIDLTTGAVVEPWKAATAGTAISTAATSVLQPICAAASPISHAFELPRTNESVEGKQYRYFYAPRVNHGDGFTAMLKVDVGGKGDKPKVVATCEGHGLLFGEPVFVPRPIDASSGEAAAEDDGVLLTLALDSTSAKVVLGANTAPDGLCSMLVVLDARTMKELARARLPMHLPLSYHGNFYATTAAAAAGDAAR
jgi:carotenoid cleavage dioxygenase-like enzyme